MSEGEQLLDLSRPYDGGINSVRAGELGNRACPKLDCEFSILLFCHSTHT